MPFGSTCKKNLCVVSSNDFWSFWFNKGHLPGNISKDDKMEFRIQKLAVKKKKKSDARMTKGFFGRHMTSVLVRRKGKETDTVHMMFYLN